MLLLWTQYCAVGHMCIICHTFLSAQGSKLGPKTSELYSMRFGMSNDPSNGINRCPSLVCPKNYQTILSAVLTPASLMVVKSPSPISNVMQMAFFSCIIPFENDQYWSLLCFFLVFMLVKWPKLLSWTTVVTLRTFHRFSPAPPLLSCEEGDFAVLDATRPSSPRRGPSAGRW